MIYNNLVVIILAAGKSSRMLSDTPKVMLQIAGKSMLQHLIDSVIHINVQSIYIVYNYNYDKITKIVSNNKNIPIHWILQDTPNGTGHAVQTVLPMIDNNSEILILYGDVPFVSYKTLKQLKDVKSQCDISLLTANLIDPQGYGRIIRNEYGKVINIIEELDIINTNACFKKIKEVNSGIFITIAKYLKSWLKKVIHKNLKKELYLTDIINIAHTDNYQICTIQPNNVFEIIGINNKLDLIRAERIFQKEQAKKLLKLGLIIADPNRFDLRGTLRFEKDVYIDINVIIEGHVSLGNRVKIGAGCILKNVTIGDDVTVFPFSMIENSEINFDSKIGPFARIRPGTRIQEKTCIGNFVELKNTQLGKESKVNHLSYLGDSDIGSKVNIGAGTIVCNYDGFKKHHTKIEDNCFIGADSQLIAPITIGKNAIIGAGTTVTKNISEGDKIISRIHQFSILNKKNI